MAAACLALLLILFLPLVAPPLVSSGGIFTGAGVAEAAELLFSENFETGAPTWMINAGVWGIGVPTSGPGAAHQGTSVAATNLSGDYPDETDSRLISPALNLPAIGLNEVILLRFWQWYSYAYADRGSVDVSVWNGSAWGGWEHVADPAPGSNSSDWSWVGVDLSVYAGKRVRLAFSHWSASSGASSGWYIDEVAIWRMASSWIGQEGFENGWKDWYTDKGVWQIGVPSSGPSAAHEGTSVAATNLSGDYPDETDSRLISPPVFLPAIGANEVILLRFWQWYSYAYADGGSVDVSVWNGSAWGGWQHVADPAPGSSSSDWSRTDVELTAYAGKRIRVAFSHWSASSGASSGWYIDEVKFEFGDSDNDGMPDSWETIYFGNLSRDGTGDWDGDGLSDLLECQMQTNPKLKDTDGDGMQDGWEVKYGLQPLVKDDAGDLDQDGYTNYQEYLFGTLPNSKTSQPIALGPDFNVNLLTDYTVFRPSKGLWFGKDPQNAAGFSKAWGTSGDIPVTGDFDGDHKVDVGVWRPTKGYWYILLSSYNYAAADAVSTVYGTNGDIPVPGDYDGDGATDIGIFRPSTGTWFAKDIYGNPITTQKWGANGDIPVPADYDGDGRTDLGVWRPSSGYWYVKDVDGIVIASWRWGANGDVPLPADYDGDSIADFAVWRPANATWYVWKSSVDAILTKKWGATGDIPVAGDYDGDHQADMAMFRPATGKWYTLKSSTGFAPALAVGWGAYGDLPLGCMPFSGLKNYLSSISYY